MSSNSCASIVQILVLFCHPLPKLDVLFHAVNICLNLPTYLLVYLLYISYCFPNLTYAIIILLFDVYPLEFPSVKGILILNPVNF